MTKYFLKNISKRNEMEDANKKGKGLNFVFGIIGGIILYKVIFDYVIPAFTG